MLLDSAGAFVCGSVVGRRLRPDAASFVGKGKLAEIGALAAQTSAGLIAFNHELTAGQQRNIEKSTGCRVVDRTSLILDIFAQRARSYDGKLQVELAQLEHLSTRLVRGWSHLERQRGGIGLRGPGEKQLEMDRRLIGKRVAELKGRLVQQERQHAVQRRRREKNQVLSVSLVGYTNVGKSTLFNALTRADAFSDNRLFATLDTTTRKLHLPSRDATLSDTVGFVRDLPHELVAAFRATLVETAQSDLLLHVVDFSADSRQQQVDSVRSVLHAIGATDERQILVLNKIDAVPGGSAGIERDAHGKISRVRLSARTGEGVPMLRAAIAEIADEHMGLGRRSKLNALIGRRPKMLGQARK